MSVVSLNHHLEHVEFIKFDEYIWDVCGIKSSTSNCKLLVMKL